MNTLEYWDNAHIYIYKDTKAFDDDDDDDALR